MNHRFLALARLDVFALAEFFEDRQTGLGDRVIDAVEARAVALGGQPHSGGRVNRCPRGREIREVLVRPYSIIITYEIVPNEVVILSVVHGRSRRQPWRGRRP